MKRLSLALASLLLVSLAIFATEKPAMPFASFTPPVVEYQFAINGVVPNGVQPLRLAAAAADALQTGEGRDYPILDLTTQRVTLGVDTTFNTATGTVTYNVSKNGNPIGTALNVTAGATNNVGVSFAAQFSPADVIGVQVSGVTGLGISRALIVVKLQ